MGSRRSLCVAASVACGALLACLLLGQPSSGQPPVEPPPAAPPLPQMHGRYQMELIAHGGGTTSTTVFICDTHTGKVWYRETLSTVTEWTDMGSPVPEPPPQAGRRPIGRGGR